MAKCLRCGAGNEWIQGKAASSESDRLLELEAALIAIRDHEHCTDGYACQDKNLELAYSSDGFVRIGMEYGHRCAAEIAAKVLGEKG